MRRMFILFAVATFATGCGGHGSTRPSGDTTPPGIVRDLSADVLSAYSVRLTWTAPGNDGNKGTASRYDIRTSDTRLEGDAWANAAPVRNTTLPRAGGSADSLILHGFAVTDTVYFALRAADEVPNWSPWSNIAFGRSDEVPPAAVTDLTVTSVGDDAVTLSWTATGGDLSTGQASSYDLRYSVVPDFAWNDWTPAQGLPQPRLAGQRESFTVDHLWVGQAYLFWLKVADEVPNWSAPSNKVLAKTGVRPAAVRDLRISRATYSSLTLEWTATGDDSIRGRASGYVLRMARYPINAWDQMRAVVDTPVPGPSGQTDSVTVTGLWPENGYCFRIAAVDDVPLQSTPSNLVLGLTRSRVLPDSVDVTPFVEMARRQRFCADIRHRLFLIDHRLVFWDRAGNCSDGSFDEILFGGLTDYVLCAYADNAAGAIRDYRVEMFHEMFDTILNNLHSPNLGLGPDHTVSPIPF